MKAVAALRVRTRPPRGKHIDFEKRILRVGGGTPMTWIKAHTSEAQRRTLGMNEADVLGNEPADATKAAPPHCPVAIVEGPC